MSDYLIHHGILGQKWGVRRFQNPDGSLTAAGRKRYFKAEDEYRHQRYRALTGRTSKSSVDKAKKRLLNAGEEHIENKIKNDEKVLAAKGKLSISGSSGITKEKLDALAESIRNVVVSSIGSDASKKEIDRFVDSYLSKQVSWINDMYKVDYWPERVWVSDGEFVIGRPIK